MDGATEAIEVECAMEEVIEAIIEAREEVEEDLNHKVLIDLDNSSNR